MAHSSYASLQKTIGDAKEQVRVGERYRHYKSTDSTYTVIAVGLQEATEAPCVIYESTQSPGLVWVRNLDDWQAQVTNAAGETVPRFQKIS